MKNKLMALILALLMVTPSFVACSETTKESDSDKTPDQSQSDNTPVEEEDNGYFNSMEKINMDGWTMTWSGGYGYADNASDICGYIHMEELLDDDFNAAIYNRLIDIQEKYNVKIVFPEITAGDQSFDEIKTDILAGTNVYSAGFIYTEHGSSDLVSKNYLRNLNELPMDLSLPFFDKASQEALTFNGKYFYMHSDISWTHNEAGCVLFYNGKILTNKNIAQSPYQIWKEGKWTMDALQNMTEQAVTDVNNDGKYTFGTDYVGIVGETYRYISPVFASGLDVIVWDDENQTFTVNITNEQVMAVGKATKKLWFDSAWNLPDGTTGAEEKALFKAGKTLFLSYTLGTFRNLRDKEDDYGVIMWPTLEENMDAKVHMRNPSAVVVTSNVVGEVEEKVATILTAMAAYSYDYIMEDYIRYAVVAKGARDEESAEVIRYILNNRVYDVSAVLGAGISGGVWIECVEDGLFASRAKANKVKYENMIKDALAPYYAEN